MALESGTYVKDLVSTNPPGTDAISQGDDHIRLIKSVLKNSFPSNSNAPIVPDISGNGDKYLQVNTGATATQWVTLDVDALTRRKGEVNRATFEYVDGTSIKVYPGIYDLDAKGKNVSWDSALTVTGLSGTNQWVYIYLDYSAITGTTVTASDIIGSTSTPSWNDAKHGWYNGDDRCIFAVYFSGSSILKFYHSGAEHVLFDVGLQVHNANPPTRNAWQTVSLTYVPIFAMEADLLFFLESDFGSASPTTWSYRPCGSLGNGHQIGKTEVQGDDNDEDDVSVEIRTYVAESLTSSTKCVDYYANSAAANQQITIFSNGFYFPKGM